MDLGSEEEPAIQYLKQRFGQRDRFTLEAIIASKDKTSLFVIVAVSDPQEARLLERRVEEDVDHNRLFAPFKMIEIHTPATAEPDFMTSWSQKHLDSEVIYDKNDWKGKLLLKN
jgi:hypothetical protein